MKYLSAFLIIVLLSCNTALANESQDISERERLENVIKELTYLQDYLDRSKSAQKHNKRSRFNYSASQKRIELMKYDIQSYLAEPTQQPKFGFESFEGK